VIGHIHPMIMAKAIEWQPVLRQTPKHLDDPRSTFLVNLWLLETAINTYVNADGSHKFFETETDLMYSPDWKRFVDFLEGTVRGSLAYLKRLHELWAPTLASTHSGSLDPALYLNAGKTEFKFLTQ